MADLEFRRMGGDLDLNDDRPGCIGFFVSSRARQGKKLFVGQIDIQRDFEVSVMMGNEDGVLERDTNAQPLGLTPQRETGNSSCRWPTKGSINSRSFWRRKRSAASSSECMSRECIRSAPRRPECD